MALRWGSSGARVGVMQESGWVAGEWGWGQRQQLGAHGDVGGSEGVGWRWGWGWGWGWGFGLRKHVCRGGRAERCLSPSDSLAHHDVVVQHGDE